jgi:hypothetical protein
MTTQTIQSVDSTSCPVTTILLTGTKENDMLDLTEDVAAYSDGYKVKITATLGINSLPPAPGNNGICVGTDLTVIEAVNGAYCLTWISAVDDTTTAWSERPLAGSVAAYWFKPAAWTAMTDDEYLLNLE